MTDRTGPSAAIRTVRTLRDLHARLRSRPRLYWAVYLLILAWFGLGLLASTPIGHVDFPCQQPYTAELVGDQIDRAPGEGSVGVFVTEAPAGLHGAGCGAQATRFGESATVEGFTVTPHRDAVHVAGNGVSGTLDPVVVNGTGPPSEWGEAGLDNRWRTPWVGWPLMSVHHEASVERPVRFDAPNGTVMAVHGHVYHSYRPNLWFLPVAVVLVANAVYRPVTWVARRVRRRRGDGD